MDPGADLPFDAFERATRRCIDLLDPSSGATLDEIALALSAVLRPRLDTASALADLDHLAATCATVSPTGVVRHLADVAGFRGVEEYDDWRNSCLDLVISRRAGLPITLAVLAIEVGRRLGVELVGIGMPMHFLIGDARDPEWFADLFGYGDGGARILDRHDCRRLYEDLGGTQWAETYLGPVAPRAIGLRMLNNLRAHCAGDPIRLALVMRLRSRLPEFAHETTGAIRAGALLN